jgi:hypothetical protein
MITQPQICVSNRNIAATLKSGPHTSCYTAGHPIPLSNLPTWRSSQVLQITHLRQLLSKGKPAETDFPAEFREIHKSYSHYNPCKPTSRLPTMLFSSKVK